ncbi:MAG: hypothetical protein ABR962_11395 [Candidatus Bathyarchaeia archaeon]|jgi:hypothetical protein
MKGTLVFLVLVLGLLVTLLSGFYGRDHGTAGRIDFRYGIPFNWHGEQESTSPNSPPLTGWFSWQNFAYDAVAWCILFGIMALALRNRRKAKAPIDIRKELTTKEPKQ